MLDDKEETIEEEIENEQAQNESSPDVVNPPDSTTTNSSKIKKNKALNEYPEEIPFTASLKKRTEKEKEETAHFNPDLASASKEEDNSHTFGARSKLGDGGPGRESEENLERSEEPVDGDYHQSNSLIDHTTAENKKKLLYDKSLKAYYDPATGQYFELKEAQLKPSAS